MSLESPPWQRKDADIRSPAEPRGGPICLSQKKMERLPSPFQAPLQVRWGPLQSVLTFRQLSYPPWIGCSCTGAPGVDPLPISTPYPEGISPIFTSSSPIAPPLTLPSQDGMKHRQTHPRARQLVRAETVTERGGERDGRCQLRDREARRDGEKQRHSGVRNGYEQVM